MNRIQKELAMKGLCIECGLARAEEGRNLCSRCKKEKKDKQREKEKQVRYETSSIRKEAERMRRSKTAVKYTLEEVNRMALERGISYGQMALLLDKEKG